jgi:predicted dehydrogenase
MSQQLGAVVVGTSFGCITHVRALREAGFVVRSLVGRDPERTAERARRHAIPVACTSLAEALAQPGVDAVTIATPPHSHRELVRAAIAADKHVLCEKPFARNSAEARQMRAAAEAAGVVHLLGTEFRFATAQALLAREIAAGAIGEARLATFSLYAPMLAAPDAAVPDWWARAEDGGGWLGAYGSHVVDQVRHTLGDFSGVSAGLSRVADSPRSAEDTFTIHFRLASGVEGMLQSSASVWGRFLATTQIAGTRGALWLQGDEVWLADREGARRLEVPADLALGPPSPPSPEGLTDTAYGQMHLSGVDFRPYVRLCEAFRDRILGVPIARDPVPATFADGVAGMAVLDAIRISAREQRWVEIP